MRKINLGFPFAHFEFFQPLLLFHRPQSKSQLDGKISKQFCPRAGKQGELTEYRNGVPDFMEEKILYRFFSTKLSRSGTGLGLSFSYDIIKTNRSELTEVSKENEVTAFVKCLTN